MTDMRSIYVESSENLIGRRLEEESANCGDLRIADTLRSRHDIFAMIRCERTRGVE